MPELKVISISDNKRFMNSRTHDQTLWNSFREGDKEALGHLVERYYRMLRHYGLKFMVDASVVEDCIQELFLQLWQNRSRINSTESVKHYLFKALRNHILQQLRDQKQAAHEELYWDSSIASDLDSEMLFIQNETSTLLTEKMQEHLANLPTREREALYLRYYENLSVSEIAEVMNVNRQSVSNFLQKALAKIRKKWIVAVFLCFAFF